MTVSLALRNRPDISESTRERIKKIAQELGYTPDATLQALMDQVRTQKPQRFKALIAVLHVVQRSFAEETPSYAAWMRGAAERGAAMGYQLDDFWLADTTLDAQALERTLAVRNVRGLLLPCWPNATALPKKLHFLLQRYPCATMGNPPSCCPAVPGAKNDRFGTGKELFGKAVQAGCRRLGLVLLNDAEPVGDERFAAALNSAAKSAQNVTLLPVLHLDDGNARAEFMTWLGKQAPDCIIATAPRVGIWLTDAGVQMPDQVSFLYWQVGDHTPGWSGTCQNERAVGAAALDHIIGQLHLGKPQSGADFHCKTLVLSTWVEGTTLGRSRPMQS